MHTKPQILEVQILQVSSNLFPTQDNLYLLLFNMAEQQGNDEMAVFIHQLMSLVKEFKNYNRRSDHLDTVLYRIDWSYQPLEGPLWIS